jgi:alkanesulfonate monooxygenase SsuD/methylene tetrahydromethanopterin reductase-like flavin-dependent oxidoreductase (luciferase family)
VAITAMAVVTKRIRFVTSVLRLAIRQPLLEAKALCSVAAVSNDRVALGVGLAWMPEEFKWLGQDKKTRGARQNEAIEIIRLVLGGGMVEFHGKHYDFDRLQMAPVPRSDRLRRRVLKAALRRAVATATADRHRSRSRDQVDDRRAELRREFGDDPLTS